MTKPENGTLSNKDRGRVLSSIKVEALRIRNAVSSLEEDAAKLDTGGDPAAALVLKESAVTMLVGLRHLSAVFKTEF